MANVKISQLPSYTGNTSGSWLVMNNSGETTTYKVQKETFLSGFQPSGNYATTGSNRFVGNQTITGSLNVSGSSTFLNNLTVTSSLGGSGIKVVSDTYLTDIFPEGLSVYKYEPIKPTYFTSSFLSYNSLDFTGPFQSTIGSSTGASGNKLLIGSQGKIILGNIDSGIIGGGTQTIEVSGSLNVSGSARVIGTTTITGSLSLTSGSLRVSDPIFGTTSISGNTIDTTSGGLIGGFVASNDQLNFFAGGTNNDVQIVAAGTGSILLQNKTRINGNTTITGSLNVSNGATISGSLIQTGSVQGNVFPLSISSNTASLNLNNGNYFTLQLVSGSATHLNPSNIKPGQTVSVFVNTIGSATMTFPSSIKQINGSPYVPTSTTGIDILTLVSKDTSNLYLLNAKNFV